MVANDRRDDDNNIARRPKEAVWFDRAPNIMVECQLFLYELLRSRGESSTGKEATKRGSS